MPRPRAGFPTSWGNKRVSSITIAGPASYTQYTAPTTGGQDVPLLPVLGIKTADVAYGSVISDGLHRAQVVQIEASAVGGVTIPRSRLVLKWYVVSTGAEVAGGTNLSTKTVDLLVIGDS